MNRSLRQGQWSRWLPAVAVFAAAVAWVGEVSAQQGRIVGSVVDTLNRRRLAGAKVSLEGTERVVETDSSGRFAFDSVPAGPQRVSFRHAVLDTLGLRAATVQVTVPAGGEVRAGLGVPSGRSFIRLCPAQPGLRSRAAVFGVVRNAMTDEVLPAAAVRVSWENVVVDPALGIRRRVQTKNIVTDSTGRYLACDLPPDAAVSVAVSPTGFAGATGEVPLRTDEAVPLHFSIAPTDAPPTATLVGRVVDTQRRPLAGAEVWVVNAQGTETAVARTDTSGTFTLTGLRPGTGIVAARRIGSAPAKQNVSLAADRSTPIQLTLVQQGVTLPELNVTAKKMSRAVEAGYAEREARGFGKFFDQDDLEKTVGFAAGDVLRWLPGVRLGQGNLGSVLTNQSMRRSVSGGACNLGLLVDGMITPPDAILNMPKDQIEAIELYESADRVPPEYQGPNTNCGVVLVWTKR
ncbi:MAG: carboxypeptidase regulatory-like domain-containing protein [Gemmatimonadales bacterium]|nr:carboxypeptidase regulatory-like domain-containing protein [Gemmatimonadales bacterium]